MAQGTSDFSGSAVTTSIDPSYGTYNYSLSGGLSLTNNTSTTPRTTMGFIPPYVLVDGELSIIINVELLLSLTFMLFALLVFSYSYKI